MEEDQEVPAGNGPEDNKHAIANHGGELRIKLKMPKNNELVDGEEAEDEEEEEDGKQEQGVVRNCSHCDKKFSSGKALGGHMRIHSQKWETTGNKPKLCNVNDRVGSWNEKEKPVCLCCGKSFVNMKSLFGHMRSHPERPWRGIRPPPLQISRPSSSSTVSDEELAPVKAENQIDSIDSSIGSPVDLSRSIPGWAMTAKRGRKSSDSVTGSGSVSGFSSGLRLCLEDGEKEAAYSLMLVAGAKPNDSEMSEEEKRIAESKAAESSSMDRTQELVNSITMSKNKRKLIRTEDSQVGYGRSSKRSKIEDSKKVENAEADVRDEDSESQKSNGSTIGNASPEISLVKMLKKKRRRVKLADLETNNGDFSIDDQSGKLRQTGSNHKIYKCIICMKTFPSPQALGGHTASHNKVKKMKITVDESPSTDVTADVACPEPNDPLKKTGAGAGPGESADPVTSSGEASQTGRRILGFDLNELPAEEDEDADNQFGKT